MAKGAVSKKPVLKKLRYISNVDNLTVREMFRIKFVFIGQLDVLFVSYMKSNSFPLKSRWLNSFTAVFLWLTV